MKNKTIYYLLGVVILLLLIAGCILLFGKNLFVKKGEEIKIINTSSTNYVAYIKINPAVKLNYLENCDEYNDGTRKCSEPEVYDYELVNDDAKEIFKDVDLLGSKKDLASVIELICKKAEEKGISTSNVQVESDWAELKTYLEKESTTTSEIEENKQTISHKINTEIKETETINNTIETDIQEEIKIKEEKAKMEREAKAKAEEEAKLKASQTISLSDNVTYCHSMQTFSCDNCFSNSLINTLKSAKGHYVQNATNSEITILRITSLSGSYNNTKYFGTGQIDKIKNAGGEEVGGAGGCDDELTKDVCNKFHLLCE